MINKQISFLISLIASFLFSVISYAQVDRVNKNLEKNIQIINASKNIILDKQIEATYWDLAGYLGANYISSYLVMEKALGDLRLLKESDKENFIEILRRSQQEDGSWQAVQDINHKQGNLDATIWNYLYLYNYTGYDQVLLLKAKKFILEKGGIEKASLFTKFNLAILGYYPYSKLPVLPKIIVNKEDNFNPFKKTYFGQWIGPHLAALYALRKAKIVFPLTLQDSLSSYKDSKRSIEKMDEEFIQKILSQQLYNGSWGGYTSSTLLNMFVLKNAGFQIEANPLSRGMEFINQRYFQGSFSRFMGSTQDGRCWDTILMVIGLLKTGQFEVINKNTFNFLMSMQTEIGGIPFGQGFEYAPDVDDTAEWVIAMHLLITNEKISSLLSYDEIKNAQKAISKAADFILKMQNDDGGWGAFSKNNDQKFFVDLFVKRFADSADFYDESSVDVTAHAIEALIISGYDNKNTIDKSVKYFKKQQGKNGSWLGRWGVNYIYGTSAALVALNLVTAKYQNVAAQKMTNLGLSWLLSVQNQDGGFGETTLSYTDKNLAGKGLSTVSQTAWGLMALNSLLDINRTERNKAVEFLHKNFETKNDWIDDSATGTGHPGIIYMVYPSYAYAFTMMALGGFD